MMNRGHPSYSPRWAEHGAKTEISIFRPLQDGSFDAHTCPVPPARNRLSKHSRRARPCDCESFYSLQKKLFLFTNPGNCQNQEKEESARKLAQGIETGQGCPRMATGKGQKKIAHSWNISGMIFSIPEDKKKCRSFEGIVVIVFREDYCFYFSHSDFYFLLCAFVYLEIIILCSV